MLFQKTGLPLWDRKLPVALAPVVTPKFQAPLKVPFTSEIPQLTALGEVETRVKKGAPLYCDDNGLVTVASATGTVRSYITVVYPVVSAITCAVLEQEAGEPSPLGLGLSSKKVSAAEIIDASKKAGIVDALDGIPLYEKLTKAKGFVLVGDAVEAQPFSSSAFAVLIEQADAVKKGLALAATAMGAIASHVTVCVENEKLIAAVKSAYTKSECFFAPPRYPVDVFTKHKGNVCRIGVQALAALHDAVYLDMAATSIVVTVAGSAVKEPQNLRVPYGTPIQSLLEFCGVPNLEGAVIIGDAINGIAVSDTTLPVLHTTTCILALKKVAPTENDPCIGCGNCATVCHKGLLPYEIVRRTENLHYEKLVHLRAHLCDGCGACSYVCPAKRDVMGVVASAAQNDHAVFLDFGGDDNA